MPEQGRVAVMSFDVIGDGCGRVPAVDRPAHDAERLDRQLLRAHSLPASGQIPRRFSGVLPLQDDRRSGRAGQWVIATARLAVAISMVITIMLATTFGTLATRSMVLASAGEMPAGSARALRELRATGRPSFRTTTTVRLHRREQFTTALDRAPCGIAASRGKLHGIREVERLAPDRHQHEAQGLAASTRRPCHPSEHPPMVIRLTSEEHDAVLRAATPLAADRREAFIADVIASLHDVPEIGRGDCHRVIVDAQRAHFDPPRFADAWQTAPTIVVEPGENRSRHRGRDRCERQDCRQGAQGFNCGKIRS